MKALAVLGVLFLAGLILLVYAIVRVGSEYDDECEKQNLEEQLALLREENQ